MTNSHTPSPRRPASTYRLQLHAGFTFDDARAVLPYLADLGVTHVYLSPIAAAMPGSTHGYDVVDPTRINPELGGEEGYQRLVEEQSRLGLGQVLDIVPNHMGVGDGHNPWWADVLRHGDASPYASVFAIRWETDDPAIRGKILLPVLGDPLDTVIERGELFLERGADGWWLRYFDRRFPLSPETDEQVEREGPPQDAEAMRRLVAAQHYRPAFWERAKPRVNYRRFFLIDDLVGVRTEDPGVFDLTHALVRRLVAERWVDGVRIDHPDGLADIEGYLERLQDQVAPGYVVLEKILERDETLPETWRCEGTSGYDFMNDANAVFVDPAAEERMSALYRDFTGCTDDYDEIAYASCRAVVDTGIAGQLDAIALRLFAAVEPEPRGIRSEEFVQAVRALVAALPVYRTYHRADALDLRAPEVVRAALERARRYLPQEDEPLVFAADLLAAPPPGEARHEVMRIQQLMPAAQAKGIEDTAFYRYLRLVSLNEVGGDPSAFGAPATVGSENPPATVGSENPAVHRFHERNTARHAGWPAMMLVTATHDHKRGEDVRARINVLSEMPEEWAQALERWAGLNEPVRASLAPSAPDRHDEYLLYQTLLGMWPAAPVDDAERAHLVERLQAYMVKALREAEERTSWTEPDEAYESAVSVFVARILDEGESRAFLDDFARLHARTARLGAVNGLAQTVLRVTSPGVPDTYQGAELWDLSLVDPDNRRPVDYGERRAALTALLAAAAEGEGGLREALDDLLDGWPDGRIKLYVLASALRARRADPALFIDGDYRPLEVEGALAEHVIAFARLHEGRAAVVAVPRLPSRVSDGERLWSPRWEDTAVRLPSELEGRAALEAFTLRPVALSDPLPLADLVGPFPVALAIAQ
jgi:(1->4)-alpha-D-glucan 1-alpha-D-glucosylmutase